MGDEWLLNLKYFSGGSRILGQVESSCPPLFDFLSQREVLVTACTPLGAGKLVAMATEGRRLWEAETPDTTMWPLVVRSPDGSRLAREALAISHPVSAGASTIIQSEIKGQWSRFWMRRTARWLWRQRPARFWMEAEMWRFRPQGGAWPCLRAAAFRSLNCLLLLRFPIQRSSPPPLACRAAERE